MPPLRRVKIGPKLRKTQYIRQPTGNVAVPVPGGISISVPPYVNKTNRRRDATGSAGTRPSEQLPLDDDANNDDEGHEGASLSPTAPMFEVSKLGTYWLKAKALTLGVLTVRRQVADSIVPFLTGRPGVPPKGADRASLRINYKVCSNGHCSAVSSISCKHMVSCDHGCGVAEGMGSTALSPKYSLSPQKAKETGGPQWECTTAAKPSRVSLCKSCQFYTDVQSAVGSCTASLPPSAAALHSAVDEIAKANPGKPVSNSRDEGYAIALASARLGLAAIGSACVVVGFCSDTGVACLSATPTGDSAWRCDCAGDLLKNAPCRKAAKGECLGVPALLFLKMTGQPLTVATQKAVEKGVSIG
ncbi:hypothetical protein T492DRAFT_427455 [Pavlovales sp. CCMP2436]|nr:hypothetical protein T492DRAFT_427455 [Pavlovales sp. CCMP2436]